MLDKTQLRFFTLKTAKGLIEEAGYSVKEVGVTILNKITKISSKLGYFIAKRLKNLFGHQFIIVETKKEVKNE